MESLDAVINLKVLQRGTIAAHSDEEDSALAGLRLEIMNEDLGEVKLTLAVHAIEPSCKGQE